MLLLTEAEARLVRHLGQAVFPRDATDIPDGVDADIVGYLDRLLHASLPFERNQIRALLQLFNGGFAVWAMNPTASLVGASIAEVTDYLRSWEESNVYARRMAFEGLRSLMMMAWFGSDRVNEVLGILTADDVDAPMTVFDPNHTVQPPPNRFLERPEGLFEFDDHKGSVNVRCEVVVVGSGPGGALVALELAKKGHDVVLLEAGPVARKENLIRDGGFSMNRWFWDSGMRTTRGNVVIPTLQAKVLGGGSLINCAICLRATEGALETWEDDWGVEGLDPESLAPHYDAVEAFMSVEDTPDDVQGPRNKLFFDAAENIGLKAVPIRRNVDGCRGSGGCVYGCPNGAKLSTDRRGVPELLEAGGRVYTSVVVDRVAMRNGVANGVEGHISEPFTAKNAGKVRVHAKHVVLAAGVINTPVICQKSGLTAEPIGANLRMHPSTVVAGQLPGFDVHPWYGATQGVHVLSLLDHGIKLEALWADPALMAFRMQGIGKGLKRQLKNYRNMLIWDAWVSGDDSIGTVRHVRGLPRPAITYNIGNGDARRLQEATALLAEMMFSVGATKVYPGINGLPPTLTEPGDVDLVRQAVVSPQDIPTGSNHVFGTMAMGDDPERAATDSLGRVYGVDNLWVSDTSTFPTSPGVNPMLTAMALGHRMAAHISEQL
jgi:choline dehydrogenase-like flavoprotein